MTNSERKELLLEALEMVQEAQQIVDYAVSGEVKEANYKAYGRYGFDQLLGNGNPYDSSLKSLLEDEDEDEDDFIDPSGGRGLHSHI